MRSRLVVPPLLVLFVAWLAGPPPAAGAGDFAEARARMVATIAALAARDDEETGRGRLATRVMAAMGRTLRHEFVPERRRDDAYRNSPLPIGHGQTISQPYIVALMTDLLDSGPGDTVLEVGTGSGYQAAVLAELVGRVFTIEIIPPLGRTATDRLKRLGYDNVETRIGDGYYGWEEHAPFDAIVVTAAASHIPPPLVRQLKPGGRMIIPVGERFHVQYLTLVTKDADGHVAVRELLPVAFVPLTGDH